jgi:hypothetical protein
MFIGVLLDAVGLQRSITRHNQLSSLAAAKSGPLPLRQTVCKRRITSLTRVRSSSMQHQKMRRPATWQMVTEMLSSAATRRIRSFIVPALVLPGSVRRAALSPKD